jgi:hypothetical protein
VLQRLRERALSAFATSNNSGNPTYFNAPIVKSEPDEFSPLNGMRRLVSRKSPSSPSYSGSSPISQPSSPPVQTLSQDSIRFTESASPQNHLNGMNGMNGGSWHQQQQQYPHGQITHSPTFSQPAYQLHQHQEQLHSPVNYGTQQLPLPDYYGYPQASHPQAYGMSSMHSITPEIQSPLQPQHYLPVDSWQNFISQYN